MSARARGSWERMSSSQTVCPVARSASTTALPTRPEAPVTRILGCGVIAFGMSFAESTALSIGGGELARAEFMDQYIIQSLFFRNHAYGHSQSCISGINNHEYVQSYGITSLSHRRNAGAMLGCAPHRRSLKRELSCRHQ